MLRYRIGPEIRDYSIGSGFYMRICDNLRKCVVFLGYADNKEIGGIRCVGTGFLLIYQKFPYLVTVKHVALQLGVDPFVLRINRVKGPAENIHADQIEWFYHPDDNVDIAITPCKFPEYKYDALYLPEVIIKPVGEYNIGIGDVCYIIGLFRLLYGEKKNLPIIYTGNIAMVPDDEKIPVEDWEKPGETKYMDGYLVASQSLDGLSGSPVFARPTTDVELPCLKSTEKDILGERLPISDVFLIGVWQGSWNAPPDKVLAAEIEKGKRVRVSMGIGVMVPISKLIEILEVPEMQKKRNDFIQKRNAKYAASPEAVKPTPKSENPQHKEDFNSLVSAAAKTKPQDDET